MTRAIRNLRFVSLLATLAMPCALPASDAGIANHFILPCRDECTSPRWVVTGSLATAREHHTATLLPDGRVLVVGGRGSRLSADGQTREYAMFDSAEIYDPAIGAWSSAGHMSVPRVWHTATLLADGRVLVAGGGEPDATASAELYDPATNSWMLAAGMNELRASHQAVRLHDGRVLVSGGWGVDATNTAELYDPDDDAWSETGRMIYARYWHALTLLDDGRVLAARGSDQGDLWYNLGSAELFDPRIGTWTLLANSALRTVLHTATRLPDGRVLLAGGSRGSDQFGAEDGSSEIFDPDTLARRRSGNLLTPRSGHAATLLPDGSILVTGGWNRGYWHLSSTERFDPRSGTWSRAATLNFSRSGHTSTLLRDGTVLVAGGEGAQTLGPSGPIDVLASAERYVAAARPAEDAVPLRDGRTLDPAQASRIFVPAP